MPELNFNIHADRDPVRQLRAEIARLEQQLRNFSPGTSQLVINSTTKQIGALKNQLDSLQMSSAKAGAALAQNIRMGANQAMYAVNNLTAALSNPMAGAGMLAGVAGLGMFLNKISAIRGQFQTMEASISTLLGSEEKGQQLIGELKEYAKMSPLSFGQTVGKAQMMLGFGIKQEKILPFMKALGDVSMGNAQNFNSLALAFSQMSAAGKLMGQDLMQMVNAGFQPLDQLAKDTGKSIGQLKEEMSQGKISAEMVQQAFINATSEGGKYYHMSENANATIGGQMSQLGDSLDLMYNEIGQASEGAIIKAIQGATWLVKNYEKVGLALGAAVAAVGVFKTSTVAAEALERMAAEDRSKAVVEGYNQEIEKLRELNGEKQKSMDDDLKANLKEGLIDSETANVIQSLRDEVELRYESAQAAKDAAEQKLSAITDAVAAAKDELTVAEQALDTAIQSGDITEISAKRKEKEAATTRLAAAEKDREAAAAARDSAAERANTLETERNTMAQSRQAMANRAGTTAQNTNTAATQRGTIATAWNTVKTQASTIAHRIHAAVVNSAATAWHNLKIAMASNPIGLILTVLTTVIGLLMQFVDFTDKASEEIEEFGESAVKTRNKVNTLCAVLNSVSRQSNVYKKALEDLEKVAKDFGIVLDDEADKHDQLISKKERLISLIQEEGRQRQIANRIAEIQQQKETAIANIREDFKDRIRSQGTTLAVKDNAGTLADILVEKLVSNPEFYNNYREYADLTYSGGVFTPEVQQAKIKAFQAFDSAIDELNIIANQIGGGDALINNFHNNGYGIYRDSERWLPAEYFNTLFSSDRYIASWQARQMQSNSEAEVLRPDILPNWDDKKADDLLKASRRFGERLTQDLTQPAQAVQAAVEGVAQSVENAGEAAQATTFQVTALGQTRAVPIIDSQHITEAFRQGASLADKVTEIDHISATPFIGTEFIDIALSKAGNLSNILANLDRGQNITPLSNYALTDEERQQLTAQFLTPQDQRNQELINQIRTAARNRSIFQGVEISPELAAVHQELLDAGFGTMDNNGTITYQDSEEFIRSHPTLQDKMSYLLSNANPSALAESDWNFVTQYLDRQLEKANTSGDLNTLRSQVSSNMSKAVLGSREYLYYQNLLNRISRKSATDTADPNERAYSAMKTRTEEAERIAKAELENERRNEELRIARMEEGREKELANIRLGAQRKRDTLEQEVITEAKRLERAEMQAWLAQDTRRKEWMYYSQMSEQDYANRHRRFIEQAMENVGNAVRGGIISTEEGSGLDKVYRRDLETMREYLREYGSFHQRKLAITQDYERQIREAQTEGDRARLRTERDQSLRGIEEEAVTQPIDWQMAFAGLGSMFNGQMKELYGQLDSYIASADFRAMSPDSQRYLLSQREQLRQQVGGSLDWTSLGADVQEYQQAMSRARAALQEDETLTAQYRAKLAEVQDQEERIRQLQGSENPDTAQLATENETLAILRDEANGFAEQLETSRNAVASAQEAVEGAGARMAASAKAFAYPVSLAAQNLQEMGLPQLSRLWDAFGRLDQALRMVKVASKLKDAGENLGEATTDAARQLNTGADGLQRGLKGIPGKLGNALSNAGGVAAIVGAIISILDILKDGIGTLISSLIDTVLQAVAGILENLLSGEMFKQIGKSLLEGIMGMFNALINFGGLFSFLSGDSDKDLEKDIERLTASNESLRDAVEKLADRMMDSPVAEATDIFKQQKEDMEQSMKNTQEMMSRSAAAYSNGKMGIGGHGSSNKKINKEMTEAEWRRVSAITGQSVDSAARFFELTSEQMALVAERAPEIYAKIKQYADEGYKDAAQFMDEYIGYYKELENLEKAWKERLTNTSLENVQSEFKNLLMNMESDTEAFADSFEKLMQQAVINSLMSSVFNERLKVWYDNFAKMMEGDDATISVEEQRALRREWDDIVADGIRDRDRLKNLMGWGESETQQSSKRILEGLSEDTGNAIEGRLTAMQIAVEAIRGYNAGDVATLAEINDHTLEVLLEFSKLGMQWENLDHQLAKMHIELQAISENTGAIVRPILSIQNDINTIKNNTANI